MKKAVINRKEKKRRNREQQIEKNKRNRGQNITDSNLQSIQVLGVNEVNMVNTHVSSVTTDNLHTNYVANSERRGLIDSLEDVSAFVMKITWRYGWPLFKMLDDEDYCADSNLAKFIMYEEGRTRD
jgi:hypothetical protein